MEMKICGRYSSHFAISEHDVRACMNFVGQSHRQHVLSSRLVWKHNWIKICAEYLESMC